MMRSILLLAIVVSFAISPPTPESRLDRTNEQPKPQGGIMLTAELLSEIVAVLMSLAFSYVPGLKNWFDPLENAKKQAIMAALLVLASAAIFGLSCYGVLDWVMCDKSGALGLVKVLIGALVANQGTFLITKRK